jgi:hypothetical protein
MLSDVVERRPYVRNEGAGSRAGRSPSCVPGTTEDVYDRGAGKRRVGVVVVAEEAGDAGRPWPSEGSRTGEGVIIGVGSVCRLIIGGVLCTVGSGDAARTGGVSGRATSTDRRRSRSGGVTGSSSRASALGGRPSSAASAFARSSHLPRTVSRLFATRWDGVQRRTALGPAVPAPIAAGAGAPPLTVPKKLRVCELEREREPGAPPVREVVRSSSFCW